MSSQQNRALVPIPRSSQITNINRDSGRIERYQVQQLDKPSPTQYITPQYITERHREQPKTKQAVTVNLNPLACVSALIVMVLFFVGSSLFSIALTSYANSVDRHHERNQPDPFIRVN